MHLVLILFLNFLLLSVAIAAVSFAPWIPMRRRDVGRIVQLAKLQPHEVFYDLGCGDGRTVLAVAKETMATAIGVELAFPLFAVCKIRQWLGGSKARFYWRNLFKINLADANVIYVFGMPRNLADRFKNKLKSECKPGTRVLSYVFPIEGWTVLSTDKPGQKDMVIYLYQV